MKKRKNKFYFFITLLLIFIIGISYGLSLLVASLTGGKWPYMSKGFQEGMIEVTNTIVADKSFNESTMDGANTYSHMTDELYSEQTQIGSLVPSVANDIDEYQRLQSVAFDNGANFIGASGFNLIDSIIGQAVYGEVSYRMNNGTMFNEDYNDRYMLLVDDSAHETSVSRNVISVRFESEYVGFAAGIAASTYVVSQEEYTVSAFGGQPFSSVYDWMSGYEQGINWFNYEVLGYDLYGEKTNEDALLYDTDYASDYVHLINGYNLSNLEKSLYIDYSKPVNENAINYWYTGSFNIGDGTAIAAQQMDSGSKVLFPVAGGQLVDALTQVSIYNDTKNNDEAKSYVIGIDSDAATAYPDYESDILGSATKNIPYAMVVGLWYIDKFILEYDFGQNDNWNENHIPIDEIFDFIVSNTPEESAKFTIGEDQEEIEVFGWKENNEAFTSRDYATLSDEEVIENYTNDRDPSILYTDDLKYEEYGEQFPEGYGSEFVANYDNGGVKFIDSTYLNDAYDQIKESFPDNLSLNTFADLLAYAFEENPIIENASHTFVSVDSQKTEAKVDPWIPDWDIY